MLPFNENKRKRQGLTVEQKKWVCEQKKSEPAITWKNLALLFLKHSNFLHSNFFTFFTFLILIAY